MARWAISRYSLITPKRAAVLAGVAVIVLLIYYFSYVGFFPRLLSGDQTAAIAMQEQYISELEKKNREAERKFALLIKRAADADRRADAAAMAVSEERRKVQAWAAKYAEIKARARDPIDTSEKADKAMGRLGW